MIYTQQSPHKEKNMRMCMCVSKVIIKCMGMHKIKNVIAIIGNKYFLLTAQDTIIDKAFLLDV